MAKPQTVVDIPNSGRQRLRTIAHEIYNRLVLEDRLEETNRAQDRVQNILQAVVLFGAGAAAYFAVGLAIHLAGGRFEINLANRLIGAGVFAAIVWFLTFVILGGGISNLSLRVVSRTIIYLWRRLPGAKKERQAMLDTVNHWLTTDPSKVAHEAEQRYHRKPSALLPRSVTAALDQMKRAESPSPYVVLTGVLERKYKVVYARSWFRSPRPGEPKGGKDASYYVRARDLRNAIKIGLMFSHLGADLRDEVPDGDNWNREYFTRPKDQHLTLWDTDDLPTRFRTFGPHLRWPARETASSAGETPTHVAVSCIENPLNIPLYVLTVEDIIDKLPFAARRLDEKIGDDAAAAEKAAATAKKTLMETPVKMFAKKDRQTLRALGGADAPEETVLKLAADGRHELRWDPNRISWDALDPVSDANLMRSLAMVLASIDLCINGDKNTPPAAKPCVLRRGDLLITNNQRALLCRHEADFFNDRRTNKLSFRLPPQWWLRGFYGFRASRRNGPKSGAHAAH